MANQTANIEEKSNSGFARYRDVAAMFAHFAEAHWPCQDPVDCISLTCSRKVMFGTLFSILPEQLGGANRGGSSSHNGAAAIIVF